MHIWQKDSYAGEHKVERERQLVREKEERNLTPEKIRPRGKTGWQEWKDSWRTEDGDDYVGKERFDWDQTTKDGSAWSLKKTGEALRGSENRTKHQEWIEA